MNQTLAKLSKISPKELIFRIKDFGYITHEKVIQQIVKYQLTDEKFLKKLFFDTVPEYRTHDFKNNDSKKFKEEVLSYFTERNNVLFFIDDKNKELILKLIEQYSNNFIKQVIEDAEKITNLEFSFLGIDVKYQRHINWNADPASLRLWPKIFYSDINTSNGDNGYGDFKHVWEINRHQFFFDLGKAYWLTNNEKYAEKLFEFVLDWNEHNPYKLGINWASTLEVAVRSISWIWGYFFCIKSKSLNSETNLKFLKALYLHGSYIEKHLSHYSSPYNHLIGEATALYMIGLLFPEFKSSARWKEKGWKILESEIDKQFHDDGFTVEQATSYHRFTLEFYLMAILLKKMNDGIVPPEMWLMLENAINICMFMTRPDGLMPMLGDGDDGRAYFLSHGSHWDFRSFLSTGAVLFNRGDMKKLSTGFAEDTLWLLGEEGFKKYHSINQIEPEQKSQDFRSSGYYIMRNSWSTDAHYLCFDCGEQSAGLYSDSTPSAAHGHVDFLSFELSAFGKPILIDPGFYSYNAEIPWRNYFRTTRAHNTVVVDGKDQSLHLGNMNWSNIAQPKLESWISTEELDFVEGSHNGFYKGNNPVLHKRSIFFKKPEYWIMSDFLNGECSHKIESYLHFAKMVNLEFEVNSVYTKENDQKNILIQAIDENFNFEIITDYNPANPENGWIAKSYLEKERATIIKYSAELNLPVFSIIIFLPFRSPKPSLKANKIAVMHNNMSCKNEILAFNIRTDELSDFFLMNNKEHLNVCFDTFSTDAYLAFVRKRGSELIELYLINGTYFKVNNKIIVDFKARQDFLKIKFIDKKPIWETSAINI